jgi:ubiquinone/menaquinone biosynthesis C-methylase UbiE
LRGGQKVLDVAAGNGNATLAAARRHCDVVSTDYVPELLARGRKRADAEGFRIEFKEADAEALPFKDESFDVVLSTFGAMFAPDHDKTASELLRVCKRGGKIGLANWTPEGFCGQLFKTIGKYNPSPAGLSPPILWGTRGHIHDLFRHYAPSIGITLRQFVMRHESPRHWINTFSTYFGPMVKAFDGLSPDGQRALRTDLVELIAKFNRADDGTMVVPADYLEIVIRKQ